MYFTDANDLETHLNNDWTILLKNIKAREDSHLQLLHYNRRIAYKQRVEQDLFVNDQILQHHQQIIKITQLTTDLHKQQQPILDKYQATTVCYEQIIKLMMRVGARVLETYQSSIDKCKLLDEELVEKHLKMKTNLVKLLNQKGQINLEEVTTLVVNYAKSKLVNELQRLKKIVAALQNGQFSKLRQIYQYKAKKSVPLAQLSIQKKLNLSLQKAKVSSVGRQQRSPIREQLRKQQRVKKQKQKLAVRLANGLYSTMQLSKQQLIDDLSSNQKDSDRLYTEIFIRNKSNYQQIKQFQAKRDQFMNKVRLFKAMMERDSQRIAEALLPKPRPTPKLLQNKAVKNVSGSGAQNEETVFVEQISTQQQNPQRKTANRYRIQSPKSKKQWRQLLANSSFYQPRNDQFNHFKFDTKNQQKYPRTNRNKLPVISNQTSQTVARTSSVDQRLQLNKTKILRNQNSEVRQMKEEMESEQLGFKEERYMAQMAKAVNMGVSSKGYIGRQRKHRIDPSPMQYTFYVRKSTKKLHQVKLSALI